MLTILQQLTAPKAKPCLLWAVCLISIASTLESYQTVCVPGTSGILFAAIGMNLFG